MLPVGSIKISSALTNLRSFLSLLWGVIRASERTAQLPSISVNVRLEENSRCYLYVTLWPCPASDVIVVTVTCAT